MEQSAITKYDVKNVDCPTCAAKIENGLKQVKGVEHVFFNFADMTLHVTANDPDQVLDAAYQLEPGIELTPVGERSHDVDPHLKQSGFRLKTDIVIIGLAILLFLPVLFLEERLHQQPFSFIEPILALTAYLLAGWNVIFKAFRTIRWGLFLDENVLMVIATGGAIAIHAYSEAIGVMIFYKIGELLQNLAVSRSRRSIRSLLSLKPDKAFVKTSDGIMEKAPESVRIDDIIVVKPGEKIPLDGEVIDGKSQIDTSALTGESKPVSIKPGDDVMAGQISMTGAMTVRVTKLFETSSIAKIMDLIENASSRKAKTEAFITVFARYYTPFVVLTAACIAILPPILTGASFQTWIYRALVLLVISCPCALVVSIPLGYFGGIGRSSRRGVLIKGSNYIDALAGVKTVVFDKTGTLTKGVFRVKEVMNRNGYSKAETLEFAAAAEYQSNHPIAVSILSAFRQKGHQLDVAQISDHTDIAGKGVSARYKNHAIWVGNDKLLHENDIDHHQCEFDDTVSHIVVDGTYAGYIIIGDEIRKDAFSAVQSLRKQGVTHIAMLTGDNACAAKAVAKKIGIDRYYADLLPEDKVNIFEDIEKNRPEDGKIAFVGDGINDAPVIARADVGVAMGALGSDAAIETADVVLMTDSPLKMAEAIAIARQTRRVVWQNIILAFIVKGVFIIFGAMGLAGMWEAVFADMGTALIAVVNSTRIITKGSLDPLT